MNAEELILIFLLQFQVVIGGDFTSVYVRSGDAATLPCQLLFCSNIDWWYTGVGDSTKVKNGQILTNSSRNQYLSLTDNCSLHIRKVTKDDAVTSSPLDSALNGEVDLLCEYSMSKACAPNRFRWLDEEGRLLSKNYTYDYPCRSILKVRLGVRTSSYTCQYLQNDLPKVQAQHIVPPRPKPSGRILLVNVIRISGTFFMLVVAIFFAIMLKLRRNAS
ncbi:uncharacterized protein LOC144193446 [Stigmatopora nigra]